MRGRAGRPRGVGDGEAAPWLILGAAAIATAIAGAFWAAGRVVTAITIGTSDRVPFGVRFATRLATGGTHIWWPATNPTAIAVVAGLLITAVTTAGVTVAMVVARRRRPAGDVHAALATPGDLVSLTPVGAKTRAIALRPTLAGRPPGQLDGRDVGLPVGFLQPGGQPVWSSWEDVGLAIMAPRTGKTTALTIPMALSAPGPLICTENKAGLWAATARLRAERSGRPVWVFDPNSIAHVDQSWWWNPLATIGSYAEAFRFAGHFTHTLVHDGERDFWTGAAQDLLAGLLLAAAVAGRDLTAVYSWLNDSGNPEPDRLLHAAGFTADADSLAGRRAGAIETREGIWENARTATQCLRNPNIMTWVTPPARCPDPRTRDVATSPRTEHPGGASASEPDEDGGGACAAGGAAPETTRCPDPRTRDVATSLRTEHPGGASASEPDGNGGGARAAGGAAPDANSVRLAEFTVDALLAGGDALYLMAKDDAGSASPLVAALVDAVFTAATRRAERAGGRLDPPLTAILDEAANIVRIADLPALYSHLGSRGIAVWTVLQSKAQGERVWGKAGFAALWSAATVKIIGSGIDDASFAEDISRLVGDHDTPIRSTTIGRGQRSDSITVRRQRVLPPEQIRALPRGTALLFATGAPAALITLPPWHQGPDRQAITAAIDDATTELTANANK